MAGDERVPVPRATYRLQFRKEFGFDDAAAIARIMNGNLTRRGAIKCDNTEVMNGRRIVHRLRIRHFFTQLDRGKNGCRIALVKRYRAADVIHIGKDN